MTMRSLFAPVLFVAAPVFAAESLVWRIGAPDVSYLDFRGPAAAVYRIGRDTPAAWPREHDSSAHPAIRFPLAGAPAGTFELRVHLLFHNSAIPRFGIEVNGRRGEFVLKPEKTIPGYRDHNFIPYFGKQTLVVKLPSSFYRAHDNEIRFSVIGPGSVIYDSIELYSGVPASAEACSIAARPGRRRDRQSAHVRLESPQSSRSRRNGNAGRHRTDARWHATLSGRRALVDLE